VALARASDKPVRQVARELGMSPETLRNWLKQDRIDQGEPEGLTSAEREELGRLRREVSELRLERDLLVKAAAFFAKETTR
jgi:transposase